MKWFNLGAIPFVFMAAAALAMMGCGQPTGEPAATQVAADSQTEGDDAESEGHSHGGWWCVEHGIPEEECSMCSTRAANDFKDQGDWCDEHNRAESQCFKCDPSRAEKFAKLYAAKFGHEPPEPTE